MFSSLQGEVELMDGNINADQIKIDVEKYAPSQHELESITTSKSGFDIGRGTVYVLQVVSTASGY